MKTAEEILRQKFNNSFLDVEYIDLHIEAMQEFSDQQHNEFISERDGLFKDCQRFEKLREEQLQENAKLFIENKSLCKERKQLLEKIERLDTINGQLFEKIKEVKKEKDELKQTVKWALDNCKQERDELQSDFFNILTNAINS